MALIIEEKPENTISRSRLHYNKHLKIHIGQERSEIETLSGGTKFDRVTFDFILDPSCRTIKGIVIRAIREAGGNENCT